MIIGELIRKWFGLESVSCAVCEVLRERLAASERERRELLQRALTPASTESLPPVTSEPPTPITPNFIPWRVRQQMLEAEDRKRAELLKNKSKEIEKLEEELGVSS